MEPVKKRHPRRAMWLGRASELAPPALLAAATVFAALRGSWSEASAWLGGFVICVIYQWRVHHAWAWGWRTGRQDTLDRVVPLVDIHASGTPERLREAYMAEAPTWRQTRDRLVQIDSKATLEVTMKQAFWS